MGLFSGRMSSHYSEFPSPPYGDLTFAKKPKLPNPDPRNYKVVKLKESENYIVVMINYPDCTNYEGNKVVVYKDITVIDLLNQKIIDPHFAGKKEVLSPIARFVPTEEGWDMAIAFVEMMNKKG